MSLLTKRLAIVLLFVILLSELIYATNSAIFSLRVEVLEPIQVTVIEDMNFGKVFLGSETTTIDPTEPDIDTIPASFQIYGERNTEYSVTLPTKVNITNGVNSLTISNFTSDLANNIGTLDESGITILRIGATLQKIEQSVSPGLYTGSAAIQVCYLY